MVNDDAPPPVSSDGEQPHHLLTPAAPRHLEQFEDETAEKSRAQDDIRDSLTKMLETYCKSQDIPYLSADELLYEELTNDQRRWVSSFLNLWDANERSK